MTSPLFYWIFLALCAAYILARGGPPERAGIAIAIAASILSALLTRDLVSRFTRVETGIFLVDLATLAAFLLLVARADRYWPLWVAGIQAVGVVTHAAVLLNPAVVPRVYAFAQALWCYPILLAMVAGTIRHRRRLARDGADSSWVRFSAPSTPPALKAGPPA